MFPFHNVDDDSTEFSFMEQINKLSYTALYQNEPYFINVDEILPLVLPCFIMCQHIPENQIDCSC